MSNFYTLLSRIYQKPGLYLGSPSLSNLYMFLQGYWFSREEQGIALSQEEEEFTEFQTWIQQRFDITASVSWAKIILLHATDERDAFELFYQLWAEFISQQHPEQELKTELAKVGIKPG